MRAKTRHALHHSLDDALEGALPSGMRATNDTRLRIGKQHRRTIRSKNAKPNTPHGGHHGIAPWRVLPRPWRCHLNHVGTVDLIGRHQTVDINAKFRSHNATVLPHQRGIVVRSIPAVQRGKDTLRNTAPTAPESVGDAVRLKQR